MKQTWVTLAGNVTISEGNKLTYNPESQQAITPEGNPTASTGIVRSNIEFEQGTISFELKPHDIESRCQILLNISQGETISAGINVMNTAYGFANFRNNQWEHKIGVGQSNSISIDHWHEVRLHVRGSNLDLYFDDVKVISTVQQMQKSPVTLFFQGNSKIEVRNIKIDKQLPICFIVMQFTDEFNALYQEVIRPTCEDFGYTVIRADDLYTSGMIIDDITRSIQEAAIVIADITPNNLNVFYEVGYSHGIGKPTILLSDRKREKLPFDISGFRTLFYDNTIGGKSAVEERLKKHLVNITS